MTPLTETLSIAPQPWVADALCREVDRGDMWFPEPGDDPGEAKRICARCDVARDCLNYAIEHQESHGIWGGLSARQRHQMRRGETVRFPERREPAPVQYLDCLECGKAFQPEHGRQTCSAVCRQLRNSRMRSVSNSRRRRGLSLSEGETA